MLIDAGLISGRDMTPEAALSKLSYVLAMKDLDLATKKKVFFPSFLLRICRICEEKMEKKEILCACVLSS